MKKSKAIFKFNNGARALLCSRCSVIIKIGKDFTELETKAYEGNYELDSQYCDKCKSKINK